MAILAKALQIMRYNRRLSAQNEEVVKKLLLIYILAILAGANVSADVRDLGQVSSFVDTQCKLTYDTAPQTRMACFWADDVRAVLKYENGRSFHEVHSLWVRTMRQRLQTGDSAAFAPAYFNYLNQIQNLQIDSLYLLYKLQMNWRNPKSEDYARAVIRFMVERIPAGAVGAALYGWRINRNLNEVWGWNFDPHAKTTARHALVHWLSDAHNIADLQQLVSAGGTQTLTSRSALIASVFGESSPGTISTNPVEFLYRGNNVADFFFGLNRSELAHTWLAIRQAPIDLDDIQRMAGIFLARMPLIADQMSALDNCGWFEITLGAAAGDAPIQDIIDDCKDLAERGSRGVNFWSALGIGFEKTTPSLERLNKPLRNQKVDLLIAQKWKLAQIGFWTMAIERVAAGAGSGDPVREFELNSALRAFFELREGVESVHEYYVRNQ